MTKYCQAADNFPDLPLGIWIESGVFWTAVVAGRGDLPYNANICLSSAFNSRLHLSRAMSTDSGCMKASLVAIHLL